MIRAVALVLMLLAGCDDAPPVTLAENGGDVAATEKATLDDIAAAEAAARAGNGGTADAE